MKIWIELLVNYWVTKIHSKPTEIIENKYLLNAHYVKFQILLQWIQPDEICNELFELNDGGTKLDDKLLFIPFLYDHVVVW